MDTDAPEQLCHQHEDQQTGQTLHDAFQRLLQEGINQLVKALIAQLDQRKVDSCANKNGECKRAQRTEALGHVGGHGVRHLKVEYVRFYKLAVDFHRDQCNDHTKEQAACCGVILAQHIGNGDLNVIYSGHNVSRQDRNKGTYSHNAGVRTIA